MLTFAGYIQIRYAMRNLLDYIVPIVAICLFFCSCSTNSDRDKLPFNEGERISFSISSAPSVPNSKSLSTAEYVISGFSLYCDNDYELSPMQISSNTHYSGSTYPSGGKVYERLDWVTGDIITIFSDNASTASGSRFADYKINAVKPSSTHKSTATIEAVAGNNSLLWGNASLTHRFVAVYPSSSSITSSMSESFIEGVKYGISNSSVKDAIIPPHQYAVRASATSMVYEPDMSYAYMGAAVSASNASTVNLSFTPLFNAYEFRLVKDGEADMKLKRVVLRIKENGGKYLSGSKYLFTVSSSASDIASGKLTEAGLDDSYSGVVTSNFSESVELSFKDQNGADITSGVSLSATEPLCFVMLSAPRQITSADELTIELDMVIGGNAVKRSLKLNKNGQFLELPAAGKLTITNMSVPQTIDVPSPLPTDLSKQDIHGNPSAMNTANCYVVSKNGEYMLPCVYGNAIKEGVTNVNAYHSTVSSNENVLTNFLDHEGAAIYTGNDNQDPWIESKYSISSASIVWQDNENMVTEVALRDIDVAGTQRKYVTFKVSDSPLKKGNAVIAVKNSSGTIMWSWHIWVTDQDLTPIDVLGQGGRTYYFMPVDLGWINVGDGYSPFYQWGRKDPQLPYNGSLASPGNHAHYPAVWGTQNLGTNISSYIQNPHKFNSSANMDNRYVNLWNANNTLTAETDNPTIKTVYDPSPTGFCMPPSNAWINTVTTYSTINASAWDNGWYFYNGINGGDKTIFYRASGYRNIGNGNLVAIGSWAYYPSATPSSVNTILDLCFSETNINTAYSTDAKGYGLPVRPVKDSFDWSDSGAADAESGTLTVGCYPTQFSLSGGSGNLKIVCCRTDMANSGGLYSFTYHNTASWILSFSSDGSNYTQTPPSWIHFDATSGVGGSMNISGSYSAGQALLDAINAGSNFNNIGFTVDALSSGSRTVYVLVSQPVSLNTTVVRITQQSGAEGGTTELNYNIGYGNVIRYSSPNVAIGGGWGHGFGNVALGNYNYIAGSGNKAIGTNCTAIGQDNIAGGWGK